MRRPGRRGTIGGSIANGDPAAEIPLVAVTLGATVKAIAVAGAARAHALPKIPTAAESGVPGFEASSWFGLVAPAKLPEWVVAKLIADAEAVLTTSEFQNSLTKLGAEPGTLSGDAFGRALAGKGLSGVTSSPRRAARCIERRDGERRPLGFTTPASFQCPRGLAVYQGLKSAGR